MADQSVTLFPGDTLTIYASGGQPPEAADAPAAADTAPADAPADPSAADAAAAPQAAGVVVDGSGIAEVGTAPAAPEVPPAES